MFAATVSSKHLPSYHETLSRYTNAHSEPSESLRSAFRYNIPGLTMTPALIKFRYNLGTESIEAPLIIQFETF